MSASKPSSLGAGALASLAIAIGYFPIGISFGVATVQAGFGAWDAIVLSAFIYAGAAQFFAVALLAGGTPVIVAGLSVAATNLRHVLYGPALLESAGREASTRHAWAWSFGLSDGAFASAVVALARGTARFSERWIFGVCLFHYLSWVSGTAVGALVGSAVQDYPAIDAGLGFLMPALFLAMLLPLFSKAQLPVIAVTIAVTVPLSLAISPTLGLLAGMVAGALAGAVRTKRGNTP